MLEHHRVIVAKDRRGWWVRLEGSSLRDCFPTLTQAVHLGRRLAHQFKPAALVIYHCDGEEERQWVEPCASP